MRSAVAAPEVYVEVDGERLRSAALSQLASIRVARRLSLPAQCELAFVVDDVDAMEGLEPLVVGTAVKVEVPGDDGPLFAGDVTAREWVHEADGVTELRVRAYDALHRLRKRQRVVARTDVTVADLASELAGDVGLSARVLADGPTWPVLVQHRQSDLELLQETAERAGLWAVVDDGELVLVTLEGHGEPVELTVRDNLVAARFDATAEAACREVTATGWDPAAAVTLEGSASAARSGRDIPLDAPPESVGADGQRFLAGQTGPTAAHLDSLAQAELDLRAAREVTLNGTADGHARLRPGRRVQVRGAHPEVCGTYVLTSTTHTLDAVGYYCMVESAPPAASVREPAPAAATLGRVTSADDPEGLGRVRVALGAYGDIETDWREVVVPGAGGGKGLVALPDVDDRVLVVLPAGDPAAAVVVGGLYGDGRGADPGVVSGSVRRWSLVTSGGQRVVLDDENGRVAVANRDGSAVVLAPDRVTVHATCDLVMQAPGHTLTLRANRIELVQATSGEDGPVGRAG